MTLLITALTPNAILMGADSALTEQGPSGTFTLSGFPKIVRIDRMTTAVSIAGSAKIGRQARDWVSPWLAGDISNVAQATNALDLAEEIVDTLNAVADPNDAHVFQMAGWGSLASGELVPNVFEISKNDSDTYVLKPLITESVAAGFRRWRGGDESSYPITFYTAGIPTDLAGWLSREGQRGHAFLAGGQVPFPDPGEVSQYVRFLIRSVAELTRIAKRPAVVAEPIEVLALFPEGKNIFSLKY